MAIYNVPNPLNYRVDGGVQAFIEKEVSPNVYEDHVCLGNIVSGTFTPEVETFKHYSSLFGQKTKDRVITIQTGGTLKLELDELVKDNMEYSFQTTDRLGSQSVYVPKVERVFFSTGTAVVNAGAAIYDVLWVKPTTGETVYSEGATGDYTVTAGTGSIVQTVGTSIGASDEVVVAYRVTKTATRYSIFSDTDIRGRLHIVSYGVDGGGPSTYMYFPMTEIKPEGDVNLFSMEEPKKFTLNMELVQVGALYGYIYTW
jgi:hypothetical protein